MDNQNQQPNWQQQQYQQPPYQQPSYQHPQYQQSYYQPNYAQGQRPAKPDNYLVWAILSTLFCCLPLGIVSIVYSARVDSLYNSGDYFGAQDAANKAKNWAMWSALSCIIIVILAVIIAVFANLANM